MTTTQCDKCGIETKYLYKIVKSGGTITRKEIGEVCGDCFEKLKKYLTTFKRKQTKLESITMSKPIYLSPETKINNMKYKE